MHVNDEIFAKEKVGRLLLKFSIPAIISLFVAELYNMVDTLFVGRAIGASGIGALIIAFPVQRLIIAVSMMIAVGAATSVARSCGENNYKYMKETIQNSISLVFAIVLPIIILISIFNKQIIMHLGASPATFSYANEYIRITLISSLFLCLTMVCNQIMVSLGNTKITLISTSIGAIGNIILDYILVVLLSYGVKGAAIATAVSQFLAFLYTFNRFLEIRKSYDLSFKFNFNKNISLNIIAVGFTTFIIEVEDGLVIAVLNNLLLTSTGDIGIIILGIISKVSMFMYITIIGISSSMQPIVAYNFGSCQYRRLRETVKKTIFAITSTSLIVWGLAFFLSAQMIGLFIKDEYIIRESVKAFKIMIAAYPLLGLYYVTLYYNQAIGKAKTAFCLSICKQVILVIPLSFIFIKVFNMGALGVWISYPIGDVLVFILSSLLLKKWKLRMSLKVKRNILTTPEIV